MTIILQDFSNLCGNIKIILIDTTLSFQSDNTPNFNVIVIQLRATKSRKEAIQQGRINHEAPRLKGPQKQKNKKKIDSGAPKLLKNEKIQWKKKLRINLISASGPPKLLIGQYHSDAIVHAYFHSKRNKLFYTNEHLYISLFFEKNLFIKSRYTFALQKYFNSNVRC